MNGVLKQKVCETRDQVASVALDAGFLCLWGVIQYLADLLLDALRRQFGDTDAILLWIIQLAFAVATAMPIIMHLFRDVMILVIRSKREIQIENHLKACPSRECPLGVITGE